MRNKFTRYTLTKRRLYNIPPADDWNSLLNYWGRTAPYPGYIPMNYPGSTVVDPILPYPGMPMTSANFEKILAEAQKYLGRPYVSGGKRPPDFDCSGLVGWCYTLFELMPPKWGTENISYTGYIWSWLMSVGGRVDESEAAPGDICCWNGTGGTMYEPNAHVAIYIGNGYVIDSSRGGIQYRLVSWHPASRFRGYFRCTDGLWY